MAMNELRKEVEAAAMAELNRANAKFPLFNSTHEGYAVILEEAEEAQEAMENVKTSLTQKLYGVAMLILTAVSVKLLEGDITVAFILVPMGIVLITSKEMLIVNEYFWESEGV